MKTINELLNDSNRIIFLDFEATQFSQEIIAIGAIKAELDNKKMIKKCDEGIKIYVYTDTSVDGLIENLTGINQELLNKEGVSFVSAIERLKKYVGENLNFTSFMTYGSFDMKLLHQTSALYNLENDEFIQRIRQKNIDLAHVISNYIRSDKNEQLSLVNVLKVFKITPYGYHHDPKSDAKNLMLLYDAFLKNKSILKKEYIKVLLKNPHLQGPIRKALIKIIKDKNCTNVDFYNFVEEELKW